MITVAVDCMGGDVGVGVTLPACEAFLASHPQAHLLLVGQPEMLKKSRHSPGLFVRITEIMRLAPKLKNLSCE